MCFNLRQKPHFWNALKNCVSCTNWFLFLKPLHNPSLQHKVFWIFVKSIIHKITILFTNNLSWILPLRIISDSGPFLKLFRYSALNNLSLEYFHANLKFTPVRIKFKISVVRIWNNMKNAWKSIKYARKPWILHKKNFLQKIGLKIARKLFFQLKMHKNLFFFLFSRTFNEPRLSTECVKL